MKPLLFAFFFFVWSLNVFSQSDSLSNWRTHVLSLQDTLELQDSLTIFPESVVVYRRPNRKEKIDSTFYTIYNNQIIFNQNITDTSVYIRYRVLPYDLGRQFSRLDTALAKIDESGRIIGYQYNPYEQNPSVLDFQGLDYNGSFSRGISFGNNQNLVLNSSFNLQMAGEIGDGIEILAAITDENIPLQAEGNTQQLREFDKIFIQLKKNKNQLIAGDYELTRPNSYFMNYYKKLQGATVSNESQLFSKGILASKASVAISRGKFARNNIVQQEGNQGPYKLRGSAGERFIIALAGTEKVYLDGTLLVRGLEEDYIIDYNRAEVEFTNKRLITKDSRIIVEFEYSDQNYVRSLYAVNTEYEQKKIKLYLNVYSEQDGKTPNIDREFTPQEEAAFLSAGDNVDNIFVRPSIDTVEFDEFRILYKQVDTIIERQAPFRDILVYSTNPDSAIYAANFVEVPFGEGNYVRVAATEVAANGRVYRWIAPDAKTGELQGNFISARRLVAPQKQQLYTAGGQYQIDKNTAIRAEVGMSNVDLNRFSQLNEADNLGFSAFSSITKAFDLGKSKKGWRLETELNYEFKQDGFKALNPYRKAEFVRDWNVDNTIKATEHVGTGGFSLRKKGLGVFKYEFGNFLRDSTYKGIKHFGQFKIKQKGWEIDATGSLLETQTSEENTRFFRPKVRISKTFKKFKDIKIGAYGEREKNERFALLSDALSATSFYYDLYRFYIDGPSSKNFSIGAAYTKRLDYAPVQTEFKNTTIADEFNLNGSWNAKRKKDSKNKFTARLNWNLTYRKLQILDTLLTNQDAKETYLGRVDYSWTWLKGAIRSNTIYEIGSGQEPKVEYVYLEVPVGEGIYTWRDNGDSVIQVNEFEVAAFQNTANYIRSSIFTDEFVRSNNVSLNQSLRIEPKAIWFQEKKFKKFMTRFSTQSTLRITRKTREVPDISPWNPFQFDIPDTALVATTSIIRNSLFFNRTDPKYSVELGQFDNRNQILLTTGYENRGNMEQFLRGRWNITKAISWQFEINKGIRSNDSEFFENKNYTIDYLKLAPKITWQPSRTFRTILTYEFSDSKNIQIENGETSVNHNINIESTYNRSTTTSIRTKFSLIEVEFMGEANSPVGFALLQGLQNGQNFLWNIALDRKIAKNIQLSLSYEGRKTGMAEVVHIGRATVRALF